MRRATHADANALVALEAASFAVERMSPRQIRHHLANPSADVLVIDGNGDGELVGAAVMFYRRGNRIARLYSLAVAESARGHGLGAELLTAAESAARARGATLLRLEVRADNSAAQALYARQGYRHFGIHPAYYEDGVDALRFEKALECGADR